MAQTSTVGDFPGFEQDNTWLYTKSLSIALVCNRYCVTYDNALKGSPYFVVNLVKDRTMQFVESNQGLYY